MSRVCELPSDLADYVFVCNMLLDSKQSKWVDHSLMSEAVQTKISFKDFSILVPKLTGLKHQMAVLENE